MRQQSGCESKTVTARINMRLVSESFNPRLNNSWFCRELRHNYSLLAEVVEERNKRGPESGREEGIDLKMVPLSPKVFNTK